MKLPKHQIVLKIIVWFFASIIAVGSILDYISNASTLVTWQIALSITILSLVLYTLIFYFLKRQPVKWRTSEGQMITIVKLGVRYKWQALAVLLAFWIPVIYAAVLPPVSRTEDSRIVQDDVFETFEYTFVVKCIDGFISNTYPPIIGDSVGIRLNNKRENAIISNNLEADIKGIPNAFKKKNIPIYLTSRYWQLVDDSIVLHGKAGTIFIKPNNSLARVSGQIREWYVSRPIQGVMITIDGVSAVSDTKGNFDVNIPIAKQKKIYRCYATKKGYKDWSGDYSPVSLQNFIIRLEPRK